MAVDALTTEQGRLLPASAATEFLKIAENGSLAVRLGQKLNVTGSGAEFYAQTSTPEAHFVSEGGVKTFGTSTFEQTSVSTFKIVVGQVFTEEFAEDNKALYDQIVRQMPSIIARKIDRTIFGVDSAPSGFGSLAGIDTVTGDDLYDQSVDALRKIGAADGNFSALVGTPELEARALSARDASGRPLYISNPGTDGSVGSLLGRPIHRANELPEGIDGIAGDWSALKIGFVNSVGYRVSKEGVINGVSLFETNQIGVIAEVRVAAIVPDPGKFAAIASSATTVEP